MGKAPVLIPNPSSGISTPIVSICLAFLSALLWGGADFMGGIASRRIRASSVVAMAHTASLALVLLYALASHLGLPTTHTVAFGLAAGLSGGIGLMLFFRVLAAGEMGPAASIAGVLTAAVPVVFSILMEGFPKPLQLGGFATAAAAIWLIAYSPVSTLHRRNLVAAALAGVGFGAMLVLLRQAHGGALWPLLFSRISSAGIAAIVSFVVTSRQPRMKSVPARILWPAVVGLSVGSGLLDAGGNLLYTTSALLGRLDVAAVLSSLYPGFTILLAAWLLGERTRKSQVIGMGLAMGAVILISM